MSAISPCPFCCGKAKVSGKRSGNYRREGTLYYVLCNRCKARGPIIKGPDGKYQGGAYVGGQDASQQKAVELWNTRAAVPQQDSTRLLGAREALAAWYKDHPYWVEEVENVLSVLGRQV